MRMSSRRTRILIVEDDVRAGRMLARLLEEDGYEAEVLFDGATAMARLGRLPYPDVLVVEYRLEHVDGMAVALYARSRSPEMPVFIVSSYEEIVRRLPRLNPPAIMISKPLLYADLTRELDRAQAA